MTKVRHAVKQMSVLKKGDLLLDSSKDIEQCVIAYYSDLYFLKNHCVDNGLVEKVIPKLATNANNDILINKPSLEEVREPVFSLNASGALGPDGFSGAFYQTFWSIIRMMFIN